VASQPKPGLRRRKLTRAPEHHAERDIGVRQLPRRLQLLEDVGRGVRRPPGLVKPVEPDQGMGVIQAREAAEVEVAAAGVEGVETRAEIPIGVGPAREIAARDAEVVVGDREVLLDPAVAFFSVGRGVTREVAAEGKIAVAIRGARPARAASLSSPAQRGIFAIGFRNHGEDPSLRSG